MENLVEYTLRDRVAYLLMNRAEKRNALSPEMIQALKEGIRKAENDTACKIIVLGGKGDAFCAGADLAYLESLQTNSFEENRADSRSLMELFLMIYRSPKVFIARIQGHALAGGCGLATLCDFSFAVPEASFGYTEVKIGFVPALVKVFLLRKISEGAAKEILLTGEVFKAERALQLGLINRVVNKDELDETVHAFADKLCREASSESLTRTKQMVAKVQDLPLEEALEFAAAQNAEARAGDDCKRGISAFLNKEKMSW